MQLLGVDEEGQHYASLRFNDVADGLQRPVFSEQDKRLNEKGEAETVFAPLPKKKKPATT